MVYLTDEEKHRIFEGVKPMLTEWAGGVNLFPTSCYGVRLVRPSLPPSALACLLAHSLARQPTPTEQYHNGSWLREHVDTGDTHIISAIMNIDQDVREDWHLTFVDHNGDRHYITIEVGGAARACLLGLAFFAARVLSPLH